MQNHEKGKKRPTYFTIRDKKNYGLFQLAQKLLSIRK